jgi:1,4-dihydroxy-2-naphthoate octaprenyltransferase
MSRRLGDVAVAVSWWLIIIGCVFAQRGTLAMTPVLTGASYAVLLAGILLVNALADRAADAAVGKYTLVVILGPCGACRLLAGRMPAAHVRVIALAGHALLPVPRLLLPLRRGSASARGNSWARATSRAPP